MSAEVIVTRMRRFMLVLACFLCAGTVIELWLTEHTKTPIQFVPFVLCGVGLIALLAVLSRPTQRTIWALRAVMVVAALGGLLGTYEHLQGNLELAREVKPAQASAAPLASALTGGNPPLAPGVLGVAAVLALAATYRHPVLEQGGQQTNEVSRFSPERGGDRVGDTVAR
jgi:hypothetical protein